jgi:hypothetical protein
MKNSYKLRLIIFLQIWFFLRIEFNFFYQMRNVLRIQVKYDISNENYSKTHLNVFKKNSHMRNFFIMHLNHMFSIEKKSKNFNLMIFSQN